MTHDHVEDLLFFDRKDRGGIASAGIDRSLPAREMVEVVLRRKEKLRRNLQIQDCSFEELPLSHKYKPSTEVSIEQDDIAVLEERM